MSSKTALDFLQRHGMSPALVDPVTEAAKMAADMERGLAGTGGSMPMIPTYLRAEGTIDFGDSAVVIDAGGTNFRRALVTFTESGCAVTELKTWKMPGIEKPATWEEFIAFTADRIMPLLDKTNQIGFCFSFSADIGPDIDGIVRCIDKEVVITGAEGQKVGASLLAELERRGVTGKHVVILNDTAAVLLGGKADHIWSGFGGFIGQVSGTGTNTCCVVPVARIGKLGIAGNYGMIINTESGMYDGIPSGDFDRMLDMASHDPGSKKFEKMTAGVYLGELCRLMLRAAADEGLLSKVGAEKVYALGPINSAVIDGWTSGENLDQVSGSDEDSDFVKTICLAAFERSARCMCTNIGALLLITDGGKDADKPVCVCAEGSLVQKSRSYRPALEKLLKEQIGDVMGRYAVLKVVNEATLSGSASAAVLNC